MSGSKVEQADYERVKAVLFRCTGKETERWHRADLLPSRSTAITTAKFRRSDLVTAYPSCGHSYLGCVDTLSLLEYKQAMLNNGRTPHHQMSEAKFNGMCSQKPRRAFPKTDCSFCTTPIRVLVALTHLRKLIHGIRGYSLNVITGSRTL